jgi:hypothetical protein
MIFSLFPNADSLVINNNGFSTVRGFQMSMRVRFSLESKAEEKTTHQVVIDENIVVQKQLDGGLHIWQRHNGKDRSLLSLKKNGNGYYLELDGVDH